jgi:hypothetical protein
MAKSKKQVDQSRETLGEQLKAMGFKSIATSKASIHRTVYKRDNWQVLLPTLDVPSITLQRLDSSGVDWFIDFPMCIELSAILIFAEAAA